MKVSIFLKSTAIKKQHSGAIREMEKLLTMWMEHQIKKRVPLTLTTIQLKARNLFEAVKDKYSDPTANFVASHGWFNRFKAHANFHNVKLSGEAASADTKAAEVYPEVLRKITEGGNCTTQQTFNINKTGLFWKKMSDRTYISKEEKTTPGFKAVKDRIMLLPGANAVGDCKPLKPLPLYHSKNLCAFNALARLLFRFIFVLIQRLG